MRYLYFFFFFFLSLHSYFVFAQDAPLPVCTGLVSSPNACGFNPTAGAPILADRVSTCLNNGHKLIADGVCADNTHGRGTQKYKCYNSCECPPPSSVYIDPVTQAMSCEPPPPDEQCPDGSTKPPEGECPILCPSGFPPVNGQCPVCPNGHNPDGSCSDGCPAGQIKQGEINGNPVCIGTCSDPNTSWGVVNGVEGCHGPGTDPTCPNGGSYGYVNGVPGCYGTGSGDGSGDGSGGGGSSSGGGDGSGGSGGSSGSGSGSGGDGGAGPGSGGGGGSGTGSNNDMGSSYDEAESCPVGMIKSGNKCVSDGRGDCIVGYHELVISRDPYLFICVADDPPPSSSSPSASSQPSSQASSAPSSQSASAASASAASGGATGSSGSGSGGGGGGSGDGDSGAGECDPTAADYFKCSGMLEELGGDDLESMNQSIDDTNTKSLQDYEKLLKDDLDNFERDGVPFSDEPSVLKNLLQSFLPVSSACNPPTLNILGRSYTLECTYFDTFKAAFGWFLAVLTAFQIWQLAIRPVER